MSKRCIIITGGKCSGIDKPLKSDFVIACDYGYKYAEKFNVKPNLLIGDFDSYSGELPTDIETHKYPVCKDDTDTMIAARYAVENNFDEAIIYGAFGGRIDHEFANFQTAAYIASKGVICCMKDENNILYAIKDKELVLKKKENYSVSLFSYSDSCPTVSATGLKYQVNKLSLENTFPIGTSNEFIADEVKITTKDGILFIVLSLKN